MSRSSHYVLSILAVALLLVLGSWWLHLRASRAYTGVHSEIVGAVPSALDASPFKPAHKTSGREDLGTLHAGPEALGIRVIDEHSVPVDQARIWLHDDTDQVPLGTTGPDGSVEPARRLLANQTLLCWHPSYQPREFQLPDPLPRQVNIVLFPGSSLSGYVHWREGTDSLRGVMVVAYRDGAVPSPRMLRAVSSGVQYPNLRHASVAADGSFSISGLDPKGRYTLTAAGNGSTASRPQFGHRADDAGVAIPLEPLFGLVVHLEHSDGSPARAGDNVYGDGPMWSTSVEQVRCLTRLPLEFFLNVGDRHAFIPETSRLRLYAFIGGSADREEISIDYQVRLPGYAPLETEIKARRTRGALSEAHLHLAPTGIPWGRLSLTIHAFSADIPVASANGSTFGMLELIDRQRQAVLIPLPKPCPQDVVISGIPYGIYKVSFSMNDWPYHDQRTENLDVVIGDAPATMFLDLADVGSLFVTAIEEDGREYTGALALGITREGTTSVRCFDRAPYLIEGLPLGRFELAVEKTIDVNFIESERQTVTAIPGSLVSASLKIWRP